MSARSGRTGGSCLILGYDRTDSARRAAIWAAEQLGPKGKLVIVHACRPLHAPSAAVSTAAERGELGLALINELLMEDAESFAELEIEADVSDNDPVSALIDAARSHGAQGIVVGHERHSPLHRALGTVTSELLSRSPVPVTSVPLSAAL